MKYQQGIEYLWRLGKAVAETDESYAYQLELHPHQLYRVIWLHKVRQSRHR